MIPLETINDFLTQAAPFYLATVDGDRPKCRPVAFHLLREGKLYFGIGDFKAVYRQMQANPQVEFCAVQGKRFLWYFGRAAFEPDDTLAQEVLERMPEMQKLYNPDTGYHLALFHLEEATAEFRTALGVEETFHLV